MKSLKSVRMFRSQCNQLLNEEVEYRRWSSFCSRCNEEFREDMGDLWGKRPHLASLHPCLRVVIRKITEIETAKNQHGLRFHARNSSSRHRVRHMLKLKSLRVWADNERMPADRCRSDL